MPKVMLEAETESMDPDGANAIQQNEDASQEHHAGEADQR